MKKQILSEEFRRMQKLAGIITKSQLNENIDDAEELKQKIENLKDEDIGYSKLSDKGLQVMPDSMWDSVDENLFLTQILNLIKKINPNADLEKKKISLSRDLAGFNSELFKASQKSFSAFRGLKDYFINNLQIFR